MTRQARESDQAVEVVTCPSPAEGGCRLGLRLGPDGVTLVAQMPWPGADAEALEESIGLALSRSMRKLRDAFAGLLQENDDLRDENRRLRRALAECVDACGRLVERTGEDALMEGHEADHAGAWLAVDQARRVLREPSRVPLLEER